MFLTASALLTDAPPNLKTNPLFTRLSEDFVKKCESQETGEEKARLQIKEFFSIGFVYKINRKVMKAKRIR